MAYQYIRLDLEDAVARLTLNRPERLNALNTGMHGEIRAAIDALEAERARVLVITGAGRAFCAGQDLGDRAVAADGGRPDLGESIERNYKPLVLRLRQLPIPVIAAVNGIAAGAGANLALACDLVIAAQSAAFIQSFAKLGLVPDSGGTYFLPHLVGTARALGLALLGERLEAERAAHWGLIWSCVPDDAFAGAVATLAAKLAQGPTLGYARTKAALYAAQSEGLAASIDRERDFQRELGRTSDYAEGVRAFAEKRAARFAGR